MKVEYLLTSVALTVEQCPVSLLGDAELCCKRASRVEQVPEERWVVGFIEARDMTPRHNEYMNRGHRVPIAKRDDHVVMEHYVCLCIVSDDFAEYTLFSRTHPWVPSTHDLLVAP